MATSAKSPKLIARDVESCLQAEMGMHVDYKKIGVVVFDTESGVADSTIEPADTGERGVLRRRRDAGDSGDLGRAGNADPVEEFPIEEHPSRFAFESVNLFISQAGIKAEVELVRDSVEAFGSAYVDNPTATPPRLIAEATIQAVSEYLDEATRLCLGDVRKVPLADVDAVVVRVDLVKDQTVKSLVGCSVIAGNENKSVVFAALDAVNRILGKLDFKSSIEYKIK